MAKILVPIANIGFDPTETGVPWKILRAAGHDLVFATPDGKPGQADPIMVTGKGLGPFARVLMADPNGLHAYQEMERSQEFQQPIRYEEIRPEEFDALLLPGGHAPETKVYLESNILQSTVVEFFAQNKPVGAICHGVVLAARSRSDGRSVLYGRKTTALTRPLELIAWLLTCLWLGRYYRTYKKTVEKEVGEALARPADFIRGPLTLTRDSPENLGAGFTVLDGNYLSARWPGDAHRFGTEFSKLL
jgi:protease I